MIIYKVLKLIVNVIDEFNEDSLVGKVYMYKCLGYIYFFFCA